MIKLKFIQDDEYTDNRFGAFVRDLTDAGNDVVLEFYQTRTCILRGEFPGSYYLEVRRSDTRRIVGQGVDCHKYIGPAYMSLMRLYYSSRGNLKNFPWQEVTIIVMDDFEEIL